MLNRDKTRKLQCEARQTLDNLLARLDRAQEYRGIEYGRHVARLVLPAVNRYFRRCENHVHALFSAPLSEQGDVEMHGI